MDRPYRWVKLTLVPAALAVLAALIVSWCLDARKREIYRHMSRECHPVWKDLADGQICAGLAVDDVIRRTHPIAVERFENVVFLRYHKFGFTGLTIIAMDGHLVSAGAGSCTWEWTFFDTWPVKERELFNSRYTRHLEARWNAHQVAYDLSQLMSVACLRFGGFLWLSAPSK